MISHFHYVHIKGLRELFYLYNLNKSVRSEQLTGVSCFPVAQLFSSKKIDFSLVLLVSHFLRIHNQFIPY